MRRFGQDKFKKLQDVLKKSCKGEVYFQSEKVLGKCPESSVQKAKKLLKQHLSAFGAEMQSMDLKLSDFQLDFLTDPEGEKIMRTMVKKFVAWQKWRAPKLVATCFVHIL